VSINLESFQAHTSNAKMSNGDSKSDDAADDDRVKNAANINDAESSKNSPESSSLQAVDVIAEEAVASEIQNSDRNATGKPPEECVPIVSEVTNSNNVKETGSYENERYLTLQKTVEKLHCPFYWQADLYIKTYGDHEIDLLTDFEEMFEETSFKFRRYLDTLDYLLLHRIKFFVLNYSLPFQIHRSPCYVLP
jgi:hypothetical protein